MAGHELIDPELRSGLEESFALAGRPGGLATVADVRERRERFRQMVALTPPWNAAGHRVVAEDHIGTGLPGTPPIRLRSYRPVDGTGLLPGLLHIHGGGMVVGSIETADHTARMLTELVRCVTVSVEYRLAPEHRHPAMVEDCYAGLLWTVAHAAELGIDSTRLAIYGGSAGGCLAAAVSLMARDRSGPPLRCQMLVCPMLDDRNQTPSSFEITDIGVWDRSLNVEAWRWILGEHAGGPDVSYYAAPARAVDLCRLPPAYVDVGALDLLRDEAIDYAARLLRSGVPTELHVYPGAYHAFEEICPTARVSRRAVAGRVAALRRALSTPT